MSTLQRHTVDVGIDLGTTNSAIAIMFEGKPICVPNNLNRTITPSVVRIRANGALDVGDVAYQRLEFTPGDVASEFKRWIGTADNFPFESAQRVMSGSELSAEVLKVLKGDLRRRYDLDARAAVITVPAAFELAQCAGTQKAAALAGLMQAPLLQEPVAASLAYGYGNDKGSGSWLVFDLGGGTFDLALVSVADGRIAVLDHEGDNHLGGKDLDWVIVEQLIVPQLANQYDMRSFQRGNVDRRAGLAVLKAKAEEAKIALSGSPAALATIESGMVALKDDRGVEINADVEIRRADYEAVIAGFVSRTVELSQRLLARHREVEVESVLLVGGPTLTPYVRQRLSDDLRLPLNISVDPMTAVATGAAVYAATVPLETAVRTMNAGSAAPDSPVAADLRFAAVTDAEQTPVGIAVADARAANAEIIDASNRWTSGRVPLRNGAAVVRVPLLERGPNGFSLQLFDVSGTPLLLDPQTFSVSRGLTAIAAPLSRSLGVVVRDEMGGRRVVEWLLSKDTPLPARKEHELRTTLALEPGGDEEVISVYLVEGEALRPERNRVVGRIDITDRHVPRRVPAGSPLTVTIEVSTSRLLSASVFLPLTDQTFAVEVHTQSQDVTARELVQELLQERERIEAAAPQLRGDEISRLNGIADEAAQKVRVAASGDPDAKQQGLMALKELQQELDEVDQRFEVPRAIEEGREELRMADSAVSALGTDSQRQRLARTAEALEAAIELRDIVRIERERSRLSRLRFEVLGAQPWFWKDWFEHLAADVAEWNDPVAAAGLLREGRAAIMNGDVDGLRHATVRLANLAPDDPGYFANVELRK